MKAVIIILLITIHYLSTLHIITATHQKQLSLPSSISKITDAVFSSSLKYSIIESHQKTPTKKEDCKFSLKPTCSANNDNHNKNHGGKKNVLVNNIYSPREEREREETPGKPEFSCFGRPSNIPAVCSGNGVCSAQDVCDCYRPYVGLNCGVDPSAINRSWFNLRVDRSVLLLGQTDLKARVDMIMLVQGKFSSLLFSFGLYNSSGMIAERLESNVSSWSIDASTFEVGEYIVNASVAETKYNKTILYTSSLEIVVLDFNSLSVADLRKLSTRNLRDILQSVAMNKTEIKNIVREISGRPTESIIEAKDTSAIFLISSNENRNFNDDDLSLLIGAGTFNLTTSTLERVKANIYNESLLVEEVITDCFNISSNLLALQVLSDSNKHASNIQETIFAATSTLSLIRSDRSEIRVSLELFEVVVTNKTIFTSGVTVSVPSSVKAIGNDVSFGVVNYNFGVWFSTENNTNPNITSISNVISFRTMIGGSYAPLNGLSEPLELVFNTQNVDTASIPGFNESLYSKNVSCRYWNTSIDSWDNFGCSTKLLSNNQVQCLCDHTTSFSAFVEYIPISALTNPNVKILTAIDSGLMIVKIVISSIFLVIICAVVVGLVFFRNNQPVKSRSYFPYLGLASLFVWLAFSILSSGTTLSYSTTEVSRNGPPTIVNNIQVVVTCSLISISVCCYLFFCIRYMFYRYYYEWMSFADSKNKGETGKQWIHLLKSNIILFGSLAIMGTIIALYFVLLVILRATEVFDAKQYSLAGSISHFLIMISLMVCVVSVFVVDFCLDFRSKQISDELCDLSQEITAIENETTGGNETPTKDQIYKLKNLFGKNTTPSKLYHYWVTNDRLLFRVDAIIYSLGMVFFISSYIVGFTTLDFRYNTGLTESQVYKILTLDSLSYVFEILMTACFITVYGGLAVVSSLYFKFTTSQTKIMETRIRNSKTEFAEIYSLIESNHLMKVFRAFCKSEFSLENLSLWLRVFQAKKYQEAWANSAEEAQKSWPDFKKEIMEWKYLYIQNGSPMSVNISSRTRNSFEYWCNQSQVMDYDSIDKKEISLVLDTLETELIYNLLDTYSRFHVSEPFKIIKNCTVGRENFSGGIFKRTSE